MARRLKILVFPLLLALTMQLANHARDGSPTLEGRLVGIDGYTHLMRAGVLMTDGGWFDPAPRAGQSAGRRRHLLAASLRPAADRRRAALPALRRAGGRALPLGRDRRAAPAPGRPGPADRHRPALFRRRGPSPPRHRLRPRLLRHPPGLDRPAGPPCVAAVALRLAGGGNGAPCWRPTPRARRPSGRPFPPSPASGSAWRPWWRRAWASRRSASAGSCRGAISRPGRPRHALWLTAGAAVALAIEHGTGALDLVVYDALSLPHLTLLAGAAAAISVVARLDCLGGLAGAAWRRALLVALAILLPAGLVAWLFPAFLDGPYAAMSEESIRRWALEIAEMRPMLDPRDLGASLPGFVFHLGAAILALPVALHHALRGPVGRRREWAYLAALGVVFVVFTAYQQRLGRIRASGAGDPARGADPRLPRPRRPPGPAGAPAGPRGAHRRPAAGVPDPGPGADQEPATRPRRPAGARLSVDRNRALAGVGARARPRAAAPRHPRELRAGNPLPHPPRGDRNAQPPQLGEHHGQPPCAGIAAPTRRAKSSTGAVSTCCWSASARPKPAN